MGKDKKKEAVTKKSKTSSGRRHHRRLDKQARRLKMKITRWNRNQSDPTKTEAGKSRHNWKTNGLEKHLNLLVKLIAN